MHHELLAVFAVIGIILAFALVRIRTRRAGPPPQLRTDKTASARPQEAPHSGDLTEEGYRDLSRAIVLYTQFQTATWPQHNDAAVLNVFGREKGTELLTRIAALMAEIQRIAVDWEKHTLSSATDYVRAQMKLRYPGLSDEALDALAWRWSFDNR